MSEKPMICLICPKCATTRDWPCNRFWAPHESVCCDTIMHRVEWDEIRDITALPREERATAYKAWRGAVQHGALVQNTEPGNWWFQDKPIPVGATGQIYLATIPETGNRMWAVRYDKYVPKRSDVFYGIAEREGDTLPYWLALTPARVGE